MTTDAIEARITAIETRTREIDEALMDPKVYADAARSQFRPRNESGSSRSLEPPSSWDAGPNKRVPREQTVR